MKNFLRPILYSTTAFSIAIAIPAYAQENGSKITASSDESADQNYADDNNDIVVTARCKQERLQDVPISITVFDQDQLARLC